MSRSQSTKELGDLYDKALAEAKNMIKNKIDNDPKIKHLFDVFYWTLNLKNAIALEHRKLTFDRGFYGEDELVEAQVKYDKLKEMQKTLGAWRRCSGD